MAEAGTGAARSAAKETARAELTSFEVRGREVVYAGTMAGFIAGFIDLSSNSRRHLIETESQCQ